MPLTVALLRGINVGGARKLPMADLRDAIVAAGGAYPCTYIQSGNAVFHGSVDAGRLCAEIAVRAGFEPEILLIPADRFLSLIAANPFPEAVTDHKALHAFFHADDASVAQEKMAAAQSAEERFALVPGGVYLHTPKYLSGSAVAPVMDKMIRPRPTARNWRTCLAIEAMIKDLA